MLIKTCALTDIWVDVFWMGGWVPGNDMGGLERRRGGEHLHHRPAAVLRLHYPSSFPAFCIFCRRHHAPHAARYVPAMIDAGGTCRWVEQTGKRGTLRGTRGTRNCARRTELRCAEQVAGTRNALGETARGVPRPPPPPCNLGLEWVGWWRLGAGAWAGCWAGGAWIGWVGCLLFRGRPAF